MYVQHMYVQHINTCSTKHSLYAEITLQMCNIFAASTFNTYTGVILVEHMMKTQVAVTMHDSHVCFIALRTTLLKLITFKTKCFFNMQVGRCQTMFDISIKDDLINYLLEFQIMRDGAFMTTRSLITKAPSSIILNSESHVTIYNNCLLLFNVLDLPSLLTALSTTRTIETLDLTGCPVCQEANYRFVNPFLFTHLGYKV